MKIRKASLTAIAALLILPAAWAQAGSGASAAAPGKIAIISLQQAIMSTAEGKQATQQLRAEFSPRQTALANLSKQIQDLQQHLQAGATTLSEDEKGKLNRQISDLQRRGQRDQQALSDDSNEAEQDAVNTIGQKMMTVVETYAKQNGFGVVIDDSMQNSPVIYRADQVDITEQIVKLYDQTYPVKPAAAAAHPAPSKPSH
ncbi:MAG TPA: OmpH family outer membrane protein [Candidatus Acidoferrales bacterium]|nr:OmpH family outer membrane protein [Candidatus Acidoferrales bacterium]